MNLRCRIIILGCLNFCVAIVVKHIIRWILWQFLWFFVSQRWGWNWYFVVRSPGGSAVFGGCL